MPGIFEVYLHTYKNDGGILKINFYFWHFLISFDLSWFIFISLVFGYGQPEFCETIAWKDLQMNVVPLIHLLPTKTKRSDKNRNLIKQEEIKFESRKPN